MPTSAQWLEARAGTDALPWSALVNLVRIAQEELDLDADGKPGAKTMAALSSRVDERYKAAPPVPKNRAEVKRVFGDPSWVKLPRGRAVDLDDEWERKNIRWFRLHTGKRVRFHRLIGDEFVRVFKLACARSGYTPKSVQTYVPRIIGGTNRLSFHSYGISFDVDPADNPWSGRRKDGSLSLLRQNPEFIRAFEENHWGWGGRWKSKKGKAQWGDDMHFEYRSRRSWIGVPIPGADE